MADPNLKAFNRLQTLIWLQRKAAGRPNTEGMRIAGDGRYESSVPLDFKMLDDEELRSTEDHLSRTCEWLRLHWYGWWKVLNELYLGPDADPSKFDEWCKAPEGTPERHKAERAYKAVELLARSAKGRLTVPLPEDEGRGDKERAKNRRRVKGLKHYFERIELGATKGEAARETASQFGVGLSTVYRWLEWLGED